MFNLNNEEVKSVEVVSVSIDKVNKVVVDVEDDVNCGSISSSNLSDYVPKFKKRRISVLNYKKDKNTFEWISEIDNGQYDDVLFKLNGVSYHDIVVEDEKNEGNDEMKDSICVVEEVNNNIDGDDDVLSNILSNIHDTYSVSSYPGSEFINDPRCEEYAEYEGRLYAGRSVSSYCSTYYEYSVDNNNNNVCSSVDLDDTSVLFTRNDVLSWNVERKGLRSFNESSEISENSDESGDDCDVISDLSNDSYYEGSEEYESDLSFIVSDGDENLYCEEDHDDEESI